MKTVQGLGSYDNGKTSYLSYCNFEEIDRIYDYVSDVESDICFEEYWNNVYEKLKCSVILDKGSSEL